MQQPEAISADCDTRTTSKACVATGDSVAGAALKSRAVVRRAERSVTLLYHKSDGANKVTVPYLNRWSSLVFGLVR